MNHVGFLCNDMQLSTVTVCETKQCTSPSNTEPEAKQKNDRLGGIECNGNTRESSISNSGITPFCFSLLVFHNMKSSPSAHSVFLSHMKTR